MADNKEKPTSDNKASVPVSLAETAEVTKPQPWNGELPAATAKEYELVNWHGGHTQVFGKFGTINASTLTLAQAARLVRVGFPKIKKKS